MQEKSPTELLGYYLIIFQTNFNGYVKCWLDGDEDYNYMSENDFLDLFNKINADFDLIYQAKDALTTSSIYLWDISNGTISRLSNKSSRESLRKEISALNPLNQESNFKSREISIFKNIFKREK